MKYLFCLSAILSILTGCGMSKADATVTFDGNHTVRFEGPINRNSADNFLQVASTIEGAFLLEITSAGGDASAALDIADLVNQRRIAVTVKKFCMSGCAYVFLASETKTVEPESVVGFHTTVTSMNDLIEQSFIYSGQRMRGNADKRELNLLLNKGISTDILNKADDILGALCVGKQAPNEPLGDGRSVAFGWKIHSWTPSISQMEKLGVQDIAGYWPTSQEELSLLYKKHFKTGFSGVYVDDMLAYSDEKPRLPACF